MDELLRSLVKRWLAKIKLADEAKADFDQGATTAMNFLGGNYEILFNLSKQDGKIIYNKNTPKPSYLVGMNKIFEGKSIFGPMLYHKNPHRQITPRKQFMPGQEMYQSADPNQAQMMQMYYMQQAQMIQQARNVDACRGSLMYDYLNYTPNALNHKEESRRVVDEALIKGMGIWETKLYSVIGTGKMTPQGPQRDWQMVGSFHRSTDDYFVDPDPKRWSETKWRCLRYIEPVWEVEQKYNLPPGTIKGSMETYTEHADVIGLGSGMGKRRAMSNDLCCYYKIWSKMGMGSKLRDCEDEGLDQIDIFGDYVQLVICESVEHPLNIPPEIWGDAQAMFQAVQWDAPFWYGDGWPIRELVFHWLPDQLWPVGHFTASMGILEFLNWAASFLASKVVTSSRDFFVCDDAMSQEMEEALLNGTDYERIKVKLNGKTIEQVVGFLQHPAFNKDIMLVVQYLTNEWERSTGLTEIMYGLTDGTQDRSATESNLKDAKSQLRPDEMASRLEDAAKEVAKNEALMARWSLEPWIDILPVLGQMGAQWWEQLVSSSDPATIMNELEYRIESGSIRKPNRAKEQADSNDAMQFLFQPLFVWAQTHGDVNPANALIAMWCKARDQDPTKFLLQPPMMPQVAADQQKQADDNANKEADRKSSEKIASKKGAA